MADECRGKDKVDGEASREKGSNSRPKVPSEAYGSNSHKQSSDKPDNRSQQQHIQCRACN